MALSFSFWSWWSKKKKGPLVVADDLLWTPSNFTQSFGPYQIVMNPYPKAWSAYSTTNLSYDFAEDFFAADDAKWAAATGAKIQWLEDELFPKITAHKKELENQLFFGKKMTVERANALNNGTA